MLIVRRHFKSNGKLFNIGDIIENPGEVKFFRSKIYYKQIIRLESYDPHLEDKIAYMESRACKPLRDKIMKAFQKEDEVEESKVFDLGDNTDSPQGDDKVNSGDSSDEVEINKDKPVASAFQILREKANDLDV